MIGRFFRFISYPYNPTQIHFKYTYISREIIKTISSSFSLSVNDEEYQKKRFRGNAVRTRAMEQGQYRRQRCFFCCRQNKLKGTVSRDFCFQIFFMNHESSSPKPLNNTRVISKVKVHHRYQRHRQQTTGTISECRHLK